MADERARRLRKTMTDAEMRLWFRLRPLRRKGLAFRRQSPIGPYIVDFECRPAKLAIELDGGHHAKSEQAEKDRQRSAWLERRGYTVLRFWNTEVLFQTDAVVHVITMTAEQLIEGRYRHPDRPTL
jgi:very-short-patch-repair endonuclease